jgi:hypothetical protein
VSRSGSTCRAAVLGGGLLFSGCGPGRVTLPSPPLGTDVAAVAASYQAPTAVLDTAHIQQTYMNVQTVLNKLPVDWLPPLVADLLNALQKRLHAAGLPDSPMTTVPSGAKVTSTIDIHRICSGWDASSTTPNEAANGSVTVTALVKDGVLQPTAWAVADQCRERVMPSAASSAVSQALSINGSLDGTIEFYLLGQLPAVTNGAQTLVVVQATLGVGDQTGSASFDMELSGTFVKFKVSTDDGYVVVTLMDSTLAIDGANASFSCDIENASCHQSR